MKLEEKNTSLLREALFKVVRRFFPRLNNEIDSSPEPQERNKITYPLRHRIWTCLPAALRMAQAEICK